MIEQDYLRIIDEGLPLVPGPRKRVIVVGAGQSTLINALAGLHPVAAGP